MKIRIVKLDFYMGPPIPGLDILYSEFRGSSVHHVPIIRVYGSTEEGKKICLHVHGVFPYIYIPYDAQVPAEGFLYQVASALDKAINLSLGQASSNVQHVYRVCLVSGFPFYGYHARKHQFLKIYFYNPLLIKKASALLQNGTILGKIYQPHEAHIPYILQFMIDYNLHGMSFVHLSDLKYRLGQHNGDNHPENSILPPSVAKMSTCRIEADAHADHILNIRDVVPGKLTVNPGIKALWDDERQRRADNGESSPLGRHLTQNRGGEVPQTATHFAFLRVLDERLKSKPPCDETCTSESNLSVYPAETPPTSDITDASIVDNRHLPGSQSSTDNSSLFEETIVEDDANLDETVLDEDALKMCRLLMEMRKDNVDGDSILSQEVRKEDEESDGEGDGDLSLPLNATLTPKKIRDAETWEDSWCGSLEKIPQLDGVPDETSGDEEDGTRVDIDSDSMYSSSPRLCEEGTPRSDDDLNQMNTPRFEVEPSPKRIFETPSILQVDGTIEDLLEKKSKIKTKTIEGKDPNIGAIFRYIDVLPKSGKIPVSRPLPSPNRNKRGRLPNHLGTKRRSAKKTFKVRTALLFPKSKGFSPTSCPYCIIGKHQSSPCIECYYLKRIAPKEETETDEEVEELKRTKIDLETDWVIRNICYDLDRKEGKKENEANIVEEAILTNNQNSSESVPPTPDLREKDRNRNPPHFPKSSKTKKKNGKKDGKLSKGQTILSFGTSSSSGGITPSFGQSLTLSNRTSNEVENSEESRTGNQKISSSNSLLIKTNKFERFENLPVLPTEIASDIASNSIIQSHQPLVDVTNHDVSTQGGGSNLIQSEQSLVNVVEVGRSKAANHEKEMEKSKVTSHSITIRSVASNVIQSEQSSVNVEEVGRSKAANHKKEMEKSKVTSHSITIRSVASNVIQSEQSSVNVEEVGRSKAANHMKEMEKSKVTSHSITIRSVASNVIQSEQSLVNVEEVGRSKATNHEKEMGKSKVTSHSITIRSVASNVNQSEQTLVNVEEVGRSKATNHEKEMGKSKVTSHSITIRSVASNANQSEQSLVNVEEVGRSNITNHEKEMEKSEVTGNDVSTLGVASNLNQSDQLSNGIEEMGTVTTTNRNAKASNLPPRHEGIKGANGVTSIVSSPKFKIKKRKHGITKKFESIVPTEIVKGVGLEQLISENTSSLPTFEGKIKKKRGRKPRQGRIDTGKPKTGMPTCQSEKRLDMPSLFDFSSDSGLVGNNKEDDNNNNVNVENRNFEPTPGESQEFQSAQMSYETNNNVGIVAGTGEEVSDKEDDLSVEIASLSGANGNESGNVTSRQATPSRISIRYSTPNGRYDLRPRVVSAKINEPSPPKKTKAKRTKAKGRRSVSTQTGRRKSGRVGKNRRDAKFIVVDRQLGLNVHLNWDLGPNPKPKFKVISKIDPSRLPNASRFPNTTWGSNVTEDECVSSGTAGSSKAVNVISDVLLDGSRSFDVSAIEKGKSVEAIRSGCEGEPQIEANEPKPETSVAYDEIQAVPEPKPETPLWFREIEAMQVSEPKPETLLSSDEIQAVPVSAPESETLTSDEFQTMLGFGPNKSKPETLISDEFQTMLGFGPNKLKPETSLSDEMRAVPVAEPEPETFLTSDEFQTMLGFGPNKSKPDTSLSSDEMRVVLLSEPEPETLLTSDEIQIMPGFGPNKSKPEMVSELKPETVLSSDAIQAFQAFEANEPEPSLTDEIRGLSLFGPNAPELETSLTDEIRGLSMFESNAPEPETSLSSSEIRAGQTLSELYDEIAGCLFDNENPEDFTEQTDGACLSRNRKRSNRPCTNNRREIAKSNDKLVEKIGKSLNHLLDSTKTITEGRSISSRLILESLRTNGNCRIRKPPKKLQAGKEEDGRESNGNKGPDGEMGGADAASKSSIGKRAPKRKIKRKTTSKRFGNGPEDVADYPVNQYRYLDGPNDSSGEDDDAPKPTPKSTRRQNKRKREASKYSPLRVSYGSPTKSNLQAPPSGSSIPLANQDPRTSPRHKRKLTFCHSSPLNPNETDEKLVCNYKSAKDGAMVARKECVTIAAPPAPGKGHPQTGEGGIVFDEEIVTTTSSKIVAPFTAHPTGENLKDSVISASTNCETRNVNEKEEEESSVPPTGTAHVERKTLKDSVNVEAPPTCHIGNAYGKEFILIKSAVDPLTVNKGNAHLENLGETIGSKTLAPPTSNKGNAHFNPVLIETSSDSKMVASSSHSEAERQDPPTIIGVPPTDSEPNTQFELWASVTTPHQNITFNVGKQTLEADCKLQVRRNLPPNERDDVRFEMGFSLITPAQKTPRSVPRNTPPSDENQQREEDGTPIRNFSNEFGSTLITPYQKPGRLNDEGVASPITPYQKPGILNDEGVASPITSYQQSGRLNDEGVASPITPYQKRSKRGRSQIETKTVPGGGAREETAPTPDFTRNDSSDSSVSLSDDIFSPNAPNPSSSEIFTQEIDVGDAAQLYDVRRNFVPRAGTSKLTPVSCNSDEISTPKQLSLESNSSRNVPEDDRANSEIDLKISDSDKSSFREITPYQKNLGSGTGEDPIESSQIERRIGSSESEVTPYQKQVGGVDEGGVKSKLTAHLGVFEYAPGNDDPTPGSVVIVPKFKPPSRTYVESTLPEYNIPKIRHPEPFYGDVRDVTGPMEIGVRILKIPSDRMADLPEFEGNFRGIDRYRREILEVMYPGEKISNKDVINYKMSFCKNAYRLVTPARLPPTRKEVESWLRSESGKGGRKEGRRAEETKKIFIPRSPGHEGEESDDSLTISPCTPMDETVIKYAEDGAGDETLRPSRSHDVETWKPDDDPVRISIGSDESFSNLAPKQKRNDSGQITGVTLDRTNNFAISRQNLQEAKAVREYLHLTVMSMELIVETRGDYKPNPAHDVIKGIVYRIFNDVPEDGAVKRSMRGCFLLDNLSLSPSKVNFSVIDGLVIGEGDLVKVVKSEEDLVKAFLDFFIESDPDILVGYEVEMLSWGYLVERGYVLNLNLIGSLSRLINNPGNKNKPEDEGGDLTIPGRIVLDFWRLLRHEIALQSYTFENIAYHVLHERVPTYSFRNLTYWWNHPSGLYRGKVLDFYYYRVAAVLRIMDQLDLIGRTSEMAKLYGIQFFEVLSRGSQFRVESMMLRLAKPLNYIPVSPSVQQRAKMKAPEFLPLIMEPESKFYVDPVIVLDFQSLYPSMIIAYNLCFSTCLGRIEHLGRNAPFEFGAAQLKLPRKYVKILHRKDLINATPCGVAFVKKSVRHGILPKMLEEILDTRLMVKKSLKRNAGNRILERVLDARQLGLKLIANVTYGYTAANFSGRMPCVEVADSVVSKGRETLQRAINLVEKTPRWGARVVYGDTDSMFVLVAGKSREDAFEIGAEIAEAVTAENPSPVKLKLEKVFHPCILQTKKRYVGYMYESPQQKDPKYCAKGIETVRRDGCPAVSKMLEKCLKLLFDTRDVSLVRQYVVRQFSKILSGRISIQELTFAKEYRGSSGYRPGACVPALELARKWLAVDKRSEPRRSERVPYVIVNGPPGLPLIRLVRSPRELIADPSLRPNALYYVTKVIIPPINRCFLLIGADLNNWFNDMPRKQIQYLHASSPTEGKKSTISQYFSTRNCVVCVRQSKEGVCDECVSKPQATGVVLHEKVRFLEKNCFETRMICESCCSTSDKISCVSLDCPVYYKRVQTEREVQQAPFVRELIGLLSHLEF